MFGFLKKAAKSVAKTVTSVPVVGDVIKSAPGKGLTKVVGIVAAPAVMTTAYALKNPVQAAGLVATVATGGAAAPLAASLPALMKAAPTVLSRSQPGDAQSYLGTMAAATGVVDAARSVDPAKRAAALRVMKGTVTLAKRGHPGAQTAVRMMHVAGQQKQFDATGRVRIGRFWLHKNGRLTRAS